MTIEPNLLMLESATLGRLTFLSQLAPLPLVDPTTAAQFLKVRRHTLACYRSLGDGPAYYKFGRWIRYALADLNAWADLSPSRNPIPSLVLQYPAHPAGLVDTPTAAHFLTVTRHCLSSYRETGDGPQPCRFGRRIYYPVHELLSWAQSQRRLGP